MRGIENRMSTNLDTKERLLSVAGGSWLIYRGLIGKKTGLLKALTGGYLLFRGATGHCIIYEAAEEEGLTTKDRSIRISVTMTVNKPKHQVYEFWRKLENLPLFMDHLESVTVQDNILSEWKARVPGGLGFISWTSEVVTEVMDEEIAWRSLPGSDVENSGSLLFNDAGKFGTEVRVNISYQAPFGTPGETVLSMLTPAFRYLLIEDVRNFKRYMETGEVPTVEGQPSGRT